MNTNEMNIFGEDVTVAADVTAAVDTTAITTEHVCCTGDCCMESETTELVLDLSFEPMQFVNNAPYMGIGMLGIFLVMGVLIIGTAILNKVTNLKPKKKD